MIIFETKKIWIGLAGLFFISTTTVKPINPFSTIIKTGVGAACCYLGYQTYKKANLSLACYKISHASTLGNEIDGLANDLQKGQHQKAFNTIKTSINIGANAIWKHQNPKELTKYYGKQTLGLAFLTLCTGFSFLFY